MQKNGMTVWRRGLNMLEGRFLPSTADKSHRWAGFLRHMKPEEAVKILRGLKLDNDTIGEREKTC